MAKYAELIPSMADVIYDKFGPKKKKVSGSARGGGMLLLPTPVSLTARLVCCSGPDQGGAGGRGAPQATEAGEEGPLPPEAQGESGSAPSTDPAHLLDRGVRAFF